MVGTHTSSRTTATLGISAPTALSIAELTEAFSDIRAGRLVVMLDACHSAGAGELKAIDPAVSLKSGLDRGAIDTLARGTGRVILCSSRADEVSLVLRDMKNSLFTYYLIEALKGGAAIHGDGLIRVFDIFEYVSDKVPARARGSTRSSRPTRSSRTSPWPSTGAGRSQPAAARRLSRWQLARRPKVLTGKARIVIVRSLLDRWKDLADYFDIPDYDRATFDRGEEPRRVLSWLEQRNRLRELRDSFNYLGFSDLIDES